jgi:transcriptional regulator with XRE-family HTH domain
MVILNCLMETSFGEWLSRELKIKKISQAELARLSNVTPAQISRVINGSRGIGEAALISISNALRIPPEEVFRHAGWLPQNEGANKLQERLDYLFNSFKDPANKQRAVDLIEFLKNQEDKGDRDAKNTLSPEPSK